MKACHGCGGPKTGARARDWYCLNCKAERVWHPEAGRTRAPAVLRTRIGAVELEGLIREQRVAMRHRFSQAPQRFRDHYGRPVRVQARHDWAVDIAGRAGGSEWADPTAEAVIAILDWEEQHGAAV